MASNGYTRKRIDVTIGIGKGTNGEGGYDQYVLPSGLRISADIQKNKGLAVGALEGRIYGLTLDFMNKVSTLGQSTVRIRNNAIWVSAGDDVSGMAQVFQGTLQEAWHDFQGSPETFLAVSAYGARLGDMKPVAASSYRGAVPAATIMADLASKMDLQFENQGVTVLLTNPNYPGTALEQADQCARDGHFDKVIDLGKMTILPIGASLGTTATLINKDTGMIGYPSLGGQNNLRVTTLFNPALVLNAMIKVESVIGPANGNWIVYTVSHRLATEAPDGPWFTEVMARAPGTPVPTT